MGDDRSSSNDFVFLNKLGSGSFGTVHKVRRNADEQTYVIKTVRIAELSYKEQEEAINEVRILSAMDSPYVVKYYDSYLETDSLYIVMEFCNKGDLQNLVKKAKQKSLICLKEHVTWNISLQIILGLYYLHRKKILHRDLKSANVFLKKDDTQQYFSVKIGDLGVAKLLETSTAFAQTIVGTPYYLSPELCADQPYRDKSDVWALGVVMYECCTLKHPFEARNQCALIMKIINAQVNPPPANQVSPELSRLVLTLLQKDPALRPTTKEVLCEELIRSKLKEHQFALPSELEDLPVTYNLSDRRPEVRVSAEDKGRAIELDGTNASSKAETKYGGVKRVPPPPPPSRPKKENVRGDRIRGHAPVKERITSEKVMVRHQRKPSTPASTNTPSPEEEDLDEIEEDYGEDKNETHSGIREEPKVWESSDKVGAALIAAALAKDAEHEKLELKQSLVVAEGKNGDDTSDSPDKEAFRRSLRRIDSKTNADEAGADLAAYDEDFEPEVESDVSKGPLKGLLEETSSRWANSSLAAADMEVTKRQGSEEKPSDVTVSRRGSAAVGAAVDQAVFAAVAAMQQESTVRRQSKIGQAATFYSTTAVVSDGAKDERPRTSDAKYCNDTVTAEWRPTYSVPKQNDDGGRAISTEGDREDDMDDEELDVLKYTNNDDFIPEDENGDELLKDITTTDMDEDSDVDVNAVTALARSLSASASKLIDGDSKGTADDDAVQDWGSHSRSTMADTVEGLGSSSEPTAVAVEKKVRQEHQRVILSNMLGDIKARLLDMLGDELFNRTYNLCRQHVMHPLARGGVPPAVLDGDSAGDIRELQKILRAHLHGSLEEACKAVHNVKMLLSFESKLAKYDK